MRDINEEQGDLADPAGAIFSETIAALPLLDRECLEFSGSGNAVGVKWLLALGVSPNAADLNGTGCLHAAARGGSLPMFF